MFHFARSAGWALLIAACSLVPTCVRAQDKPAEDKPAADNPEKPEKKTQPGYREKTAAELITPATQAAVDRGLAWLAKKQVTQGAGKGSFGRTGYAGGVAVCGLSGLSFMAGGSSPGSGPYGREIDRCVDFVMGCVQQNGYVGAPSGQDNMYGHGFATLFLSQAYGMTQRPEVGEKLKLATELIVKTQNDAGGWRYQPVKQDADLSITICQIMALRGARDAGIYVPTDVRQKCIDYVKKSQNPDGGFRYQVNGGGSTFPLTAAGVVSLYSAGIYDGPPIEKGLDYLFKQLPTQTNSLGGTYYFYGHYYAIQAMWHSGGPNWEKWYTTMRETLLKTQSPEGSWTDPHVGAEFGTAMGCIIMQIPNNYVPTFAK